MQLHAEFTDLWHPGFDGSFFADDPAPITQHKGLNVTIPLCGQRTASVTLSVFDPLNVAWGYAYKSMLRVWMKPDPIEEPDTQVCVFWGQVAQLSIDPTEGTIVYNATDPSLRMVSHFVRLGDTALNGVDHPTHPNPYNKRVPLSGEGIRMLIDCAQNIGFDDTVWDSTSQAGRYPPLGVRYAFDDSVDVTPDQTDLLAKFTRGQEVWSSIADLIGMETAPEFELAPATDADGVYVDLNVYEQAGTNSATTGDTYTPGECEFKQGVSVIGGTAGAYFYDSFLPDNAKITHDPGGKVVTHAHVLSAEGTGIAKRVTTADKDSAEQIGVFVDWVQTKFKATEVNLLKLRGRAELHAYGKPPDFCTVSPLPDCEFQYIRDFMVGTTVNVEYERSAIVDGNWQGVYGMFDARITQVALQQGNELLGQTSLEVVPDLSIPDDNDEDS